MKRLSSMKAGSWRVITTAVAAVMVVCLVGVAIAASGAASHARASTAAAVSAAKTASLGIETATARPVVPMSGREMALAMGMAQTAGQKPKMAEEFFKNIQVLKGISVDDFMGTMGVMTAALGFCCSDCHTGAGTDSVVWEADNNPKKRTGRRMVTMVETINKSNFGGRQGVTCWTCHRGRDIPVVTATMDTVYGTPEIDEDDIVTQAQGMPTPDQLLDKYLQAIGGASKWAAVTSIAGKAGSLGFGGLGGAGQVEFYAKAPNQRATIIRFPNAPGRGDRTWTYDGRTGWMATPLAVVPKYELTGGELDGAKLDAQLMFPTQIKQALTALRVGLPTAIEGKRMNVLQGNGTKGVIGTLYFDAETSLLTRVVRFVPSPIGRVNTQVDYSDYRDVNGLKFPFSWTFAWLDGRDTLTFNDVQMNVPIDASKFGEPNPAAAAK